MIYDNLKFNENVRANTDFLNRLKNSFPEFFTNEKYDDDGNIVSEPFFDIEKFQQSLREKNINELKEGYQLSFIGKDYAKKQAGEKPSTVVIPDIINNNEEINRNSNNLFFTGDNLEVLRHLKNNYRNSIDVIYIDPPYNTGKDGFVYPDKFEYSDVVLQNMFSLNDEELKRLKSIQGKATHSAWLTFMYPRLAVAKSLLKEDGFIFISIDENEVINLKKLCDEIYGEINYVSQLTIENNPKGRKNSDFVSNSGEYLLVYAKNKGMSTFVENIPKRSSEMTLVDGIYVHGSGKRVLVGENSYNNKVSDFKSKKHYTVYYKEISKELEIVQEDELNQGNLCFLNKGYKRYCSFYKNNFVENTYTSDKFVELYKKNALEFTASKIFEKNLSSKIRIKNIVTNEKYEAIINNKKMKYKLDLKTTSAGTYLKELFSLEDTVFSAPKSVGLLHLIMTLIEKKDYIILDFLPVPQLLLML